VARWTRRGSARLAPYGWAALEAWGVRVVPPDPPPSALPIERLCESLHRLDVEIDHLRHCDRRTPALFHRLHSATLAYDAVLRDACRALGVPPPGPLPYSDVARLEAEAGLAAAGLDW